MQRILIIEDEDLMRQGLAELLQKAGYQPVLLDLAEQATSELSDQANIISQIIQARPNLVLLDINLPNINGETLLKALRAQSDIPVIMVTSSSTEMDEMLSMSYGADDYITKPYSPQILLLRVAAVLKRNESPSGPIKYRDINVDLSRGVLQSSDKRILLTKNEMIILGHLLKNQGKIVTRDELMTDLWNNHEYINDNALTVNISRLRAKMQALGKGTAIETRKGLGYVLL